MKMPRLISVHLLGLCLLLSQLPREIQGQKMSDVIQDCGHNLIRHWVRLCGMSLSQREEMMKGDKVRREAEPPTETMPATMKIDEENINMLKENFTKLHNGTLSLNHPTMNKHQQLASEDENISSPELQKTTSNKKTENKENSKDSDKLIRKKRQTAYDVFVKCCHGGGCTNGELLSFC